MARIRTIKPEFWGDPKTCRVSRDARLLFLGLLNESDDEGRQLGSPKRIAGVVFPHDDDATVDVLNRWLTELENVGLIKRYQVDGVAYVQVNGFSKHQKVSHPTPSRLPPEDFAKSSGDAPESFAPDLGIDLGSGSRNRDLGSLAPAAQKAEVEIVDTGNELVLSATVAKPQSARKPDLLWEAMLAACGITGEITKSARGAYNAAVRDFRTVGATPEEIHDRAAVFRDRWPDASLTPTALARRWAECVPGRAAPQQMTEAQRVVTMMRAMEGR